MSNLFPEAESVGRWLVSGWHVALAYVIGFFVMLAVLGWQPDTGYRKRAGIEPSSTAHLPSPQPTSSSTVRPAT